MAEQTELETTILNDIRAHAAGGRYAARIVWSAETVAVARATLASCASCSRPPKILSGPRVVRRGGAHEHRDHEEDPSKAWPA